MSLEDTKIVLEVLADEELLQHIQNCQEFDEFLVSTQKLISRINKKPPALRILNRTDQQYETIMRFLDHKFGVSKKDEDGSRLLVRGNCLAVGSGKGNVALATNLGMLQGGDNNTHVGRDLSVTGQAATGIVKGNQSNPISFS